MIDFPNSPALNQTFSAPNGATYQWNGTVWLPIGPSQSLTTSDTPPLSPGTGQLWWNSTLGQLFIYYNDVSSSQWVPANPVTTGGGAGDFCAVQTSSFPAMGTTTATLILTQVISGNAASWYSSSTGRYTPPAGRFAIYAVFSAACGVGASHMTIGVRKNGTTIQVSTDTTSGSGNFADPSISVIVDANGSDWFDIQGTCSAGTANFQSIAFTAFPLTGMTGAPGAKGADGAAGAPGPTGTAFPTGFVGDFAGSTAPTGWYICDGTAKNTTTDAALFAVIGYTYGGSGTSFNLPDLGGRVTAGKEATATRITVAGAGFSGATLGATGGTQTHTLTVAQLAAHNHTMTDGGTILTNAGGGGVGWAAGNTLGAGGAITTVGSGTAHQNTQPTMIMNKIIKN